MQDDKGGSAEVTREVDPATSREDDKADPATSLCLCGGDGCGVEGEKHSVSNPPLPGRVNLLAC